VQFTLALFTELTLTSNLLQLSCMILLRNFDHLERLLCAKCLVLSSLSNSTSNNNNIDDGNNVLAATPSLP